MARRDDIAKLRGLAGDAGYTLERAMRRNCWRLINAKGEAVLNPRNRSTAFPVADAMAISQTRTHDAMTTSAAPSSSTGRDPTVARAADSFTLEEARELAQEVARALTAVRMLDWRPDWS